MLHSINHNPCAVFLFTYMYNPLQHVSQRKIGYMNIMDTQHTVCLERREGGQSHPSSAETPRRRRVLVHCQLPVFPGIISCGRKNARGLTLIRYRINRRDFMLDQLENPKLPWELRPFGEQRVKTSHLGIYERWRYRIRCGFRIMPVTSEEHPGGFETDTLSGVTHGNNKLITKQIIKPSAK